jgi:carbamoylphosphate synthase small subunit
MPKVYIVGRDYGISNMFLRRGWTLVDNIDEAVSLIQFTGGEDVDPSYYGETKHPQTYSNPRRDAAEAAVYNEWVGKLPMAGICRGGQFLNVMNGGKMWQHINNHATGQRHDAYCEVTETVYSVTSTHHQMMLPAPHAKLLLHARESTLRMGPEEYEEGLLVDFEALLYANTQCLCFQPHPEYVSINDECQDLYFNYLEKFIL